MLVAALTFGTAGWTIQPATDTATVRSVAGLSIDQFEKLPLPLLPLPGWEERARTAAISEWTASRQVMLGGSQPHALLVASRNEAEQGRYFEGVDDSLLGFAELGLLPAPPEQRSGWPGESRDSEESTAAALTAEGASAATAAAASGPVPNTPPRYVYVRPGVPGPIRQQHHQTTSQMCRFFDRGYCRAGSQCAFSHGPWPPEVPAGHPAFLAAAGHPADKRKKRKKWRKSVC